VNSDAPLKDKLSVIVRGIARSIQAASSIVLLDNTRAKLIHSVSYGLPQYYLKKGLLDIEKSMSEVFLGQVIKILDIKGDNRIQYPEMAVKAGIYSILGIPIILHGKPVGSIRVYTKQPVDFSNRDISFVTTMANLTSIAFCNDHINEHLPSNQAASGLVTNDNQLLKRARPINFAHQSEEQFAQLLDFYNIEWVYEPRSFALKWNGDKVTEMFTPDFYLPGLDQYVELTTLKQSLVTEKNQKLRHLRELYPEIKIMLLYKRDYDRLLAKYGVGPLAQARGHGISQVLYSASDIEERVKTIAKQLSMDYADRRPILVGAQRGFICFMADLIRQITIPLDLDFIGVSYYSGDNQSMAKITKDLDLNIKDRHVIMIEDIIDTGITLNYILNYLRSRGPASISVCTLLDKRIRRLIDIDLGYIGFEVPDEFVVGYGLDFREEYRNLPFIATLDTGNQTITRQTTKE
jgi:hypoxanthine phosphoribosyltransferase